MKFFLYIIIGIIALYIIGSLFSKYGLNIMLSKSFGEKVNPNKSIHYWQKDKKISFSPSSAVALVGTYQMPEVDIETFEVIANIVARDKHRAYFRDKVFNKPDVNTMKSIWGHYFNDKNSLFHSNKVISSTDSTIKWLKAKNDHKAKWLLSENIQYYNGRQVDIKDITTLEVIDGSDYSKDSKHVYYLGEIIPDADSLTFKNVSIHSSIAYSTDKSNVYINGQIITSADPNSFTIVEQTSAEKVYYKDKSNVYYFSQTREVPSNHIVVGADPNTFTESKFESSFFNDKSFFFYNGIKVKDSDVGSAEKLNNLFFRDKNNIYRLNSIVKDVDESVFTKNNIKATESWILYRYTSTLHEIEEVTMAPPGQEEEIAENFVKFNGKFFYNRSLIPVADSESFEVINHYISKDKYNVYVWTNKLKSVSPEDFVFNNNMEFTHPDPEGYISIRKE